MSKPPDTVPISDAALKLIEAMRKKAGVLKVEFGYRPMEDDREPEAGERHTWYATATLPSGWTLTREAEGVLPGKTMVDALTALARALGLSVRIRHRFEGLPQ